MRKGISLAAASDQNESLLIPGADTGNQRGIPDSAESGSGLCPENPQPFEKGWRKLQQGCGALGFVQNLFQTLQSHSGHELAIHADVRRRAACALAADRLIHPLSA